MNSGIKKTIPKHCASDIVDCKTTPEYFILSVRSTTQTNKSRIIGNYGVKHSISLKAQPRAEHPSIGAPFIPFIFITFTDKKRVNIIFMDLPEHLTQATRIYFRQE